MRQVGYFKKFVVSTKLPRPTVFPRTKNINNIDFALLHYNFINVTDYLCSFSQTETILIQSVTSLKLNYLTSYNFPDTRRPSALPPVEKRSSTLNVINLKINYCTNNFNFKKKQIYKVNVHWILGKYNFVS